jgi:hypothetical protein
MLSLWTDKTCSASNNAPGLSFTLNE